MNGTQVLLATLTGLVAGAAFALVDVPIPAPPKLAGVMGIFGIYAGFKLVNHFDLAGSLVDALPF